MKVNHIECDICGTSMGRRDFQFWLRKPILKHGLPMLGMKRMDICDECFAKMSVLIARPELIKWEEKDEDTGR